MYKFIFNHSPLEFGRQGQLTILYREHKERARQVSPLGIALIPSIPALVQRHNLKDFPEDQLLYFPAFPGVPGMVGRSYQSKNVSAGSSYGKFHRTFRAFHKGHSPRNFESALRGNLLHVVECFLRDTHHHPSLFIPQDYVHFEKITER